MGLIVRCMISVACGFSAHMVFYKPTQRFGIHWGMLLRYAIGYLCVMPLRQIFLDETEKRINERVVIADIMSGVTFGAGVFLGHLAEPEDED